MTIDSSPRLRSKAGRSVKKDHAFEDDGDTSIALTHSQTSNDTPTLSQSDDENQALPGWGTTTVATLRAALAAEQSARREAEVRARDAEAMVGHLKRLIATLRQERFGASSEHGRKLLEEMQLELERRGCTEPSSDAGAEQGSRPAPIPIRDAHLALQGQKLSASNL